MAVGVFLVAGGLFLIWLAISTGDRLALLGGVLGVPMLLLGAVMLWQAFSLTQLSIRLYEQGFVYRKGRLVMPFRWEEIETVNLTETEHRGRYGNTLYYTHSFDIRAATREIVLNDTEVGDGEKLGRAIMREVQHYQLKRLLRKALLLEAAGERAVALSTFEQVVCESPYNQIADQAREHIQRLRQHSSSATDDSRR
jgi:hypothetical protein